MDKRYIVFCKQSCPYCVEAIGILNSKNLNVSTVDFTEDDQSGLILESIKDALEHRTVPMIFERSGDDIKFIGGCSDLKVWLDENE